MREEYIRGIFVGLGIPVEEDGDDRELAQVIGDLIDKWDSIDRWQKELLLTEMAECC